MESATEERKKELMTSLKIQEWHRKKWSRKPPQGHSMRKQKLNTKKTKFYFTERMPKSKDTGRPSSECGAVDKKTMRGHKLHAEPPSGKTLSAEEKVKLLHEKGTYQSKLKSNISERLHVQVPDIAIQTKTDIDPGFFTMIEGRPNKKPFSRREYLKKEKAILMKKAMTMEIIEKIKFMRKDIEEKEKILDRAVKSFPLRAAESRNLIYKDFDVTTEAYSRNNEAQRRNMLALQRKKILESKVHKVRCNIYRLEERWRSLKVFQAFLYRISPLEWRKENDRIHYSNGQLVLEPSSACYDVYRLDPNTPEPPLEELLKLFHEKTKDEDEPKLYFTNPKQLQDHFDFIQELNANTFHYSMKMEEESKTLNRFVREIKNSIQNIIEKIQNEHNKFMENVEWLANKRKELNEIFRNEEKNLEKKVLSENHINVRTIIERGYNTLLNSEKLKVVLPLILEQFSRDVSRIILEVNNLPPALFKRLKQKQEEGLLKAQQACNEEKRLSRIEKKIKDSTQKMCIPKHCRSLRFRTRPPSTPEIEERKAEEDKRDDLYIEDIFRTDFKLESISFAKPQEIASYIIASALFQPSDEDRSISEELVEKSSISSCEEARMKKSFDSMASSIGLNGKIGGTKSIPISLPPNRTIELPPIDTKPHAPKKSCQPLKKPSLILSDFNKRKISLLTNYEKSYSIVETEGEAKEISFVDVVKTTRIKDYLLRWKNIFPSERERISKSSLFQKDVTSLDPYLESIQQKLKQTSTRGFPLKSDITKPTTFPHSSYFPSLPIISETEPVDEAQFDSNFSKLEDKLRECKLNYYEHKKHVKAERRAKSDSEIEEII
ncbi:hypothetical protein J437_LFUL012192 [Ladona fulva]|uniref:DUF4200 domain-containing protein n=1 Tax=Ladona fulva TaxID=123851 RepID=A0A8K0K7B7_LADFU|nr:hypothetical protein J437_LFUL012192 [Ladona fulva]